MKRSFKIILLIALMGASLIAATACLSGGEIEIKLVEEAFRPEAFINEEFDVMDIIEDPDGSLTYIIKECFYLDFALNRHDIEFNGTKFTPLEPYAVYVTLVARDRMGREAEVEFTVPVSVPLNLIQKSFIESWNDPGVAKSPTAKPEHLYGDARSAVKVTYTGTYNPVGDGVAIGGGLANAKSELSVTDWENAVLTMKVKNLSDFDLVIGVQFSKDNEWYTPRGTDYKLSFSFMPSFVLKPGVWTDVCWSLRRVGINYDFLADKAGAGFKVRISDTRGLTEPYTYSFAICDLDIVDFSAERFPALETRTDDEIWQQMPGDIVDKYLWKHTVKANDTISTNYAKSLVTAAVKEYSGAVPRPEEIDAGSTSYIEYKVKPTGTYTGFSAVYSFPIRFANDSWGQEIDPEYYELFKDLDWSDAYVGFWVYNASLEQLSFRTSTPDQPNYWGGSVRSVPSRIWTYVYFSLKEDYGITSNIFEQERYVFNIFSAYTQRKGETLASFESRLMEFEGTFYIDGFEFFNLTGDEDDLELVKHTIPHNDQLNLNYAKSKVTAYVASYRAGVGIAPPQMEEETASYIVYTVIPTGTYDGFSGVYSFPIRFSTDWYGRPMSEAYKQKLSGIDWSDAYLGFWVYNCADENLYFYTDRASSRGYWGGSAFSVPSRAWTYVEISLKNDYEITSDIFAQASYTFNIYTRYTAPGLEARLDSFVGKFYIDGFKFYNKTQDGASGDEADLLLKNLAVGNTIIEISDKYQVTATAKIEANPCPDLSESRTSVKYQYTWTGSENCIGVPIRLTNVSNEFINGLSIIKNGGDWQNAYIGFWVYNDSEYTLKIGYSRATGRLLDGWMQPASISKSDGWTYVEVKLSDIKLDVGASDGVTGNLFEIPNLDLRFFGAFVDVPSQGHSALVFYIDGFDIYVK